MKKVIFFGLLTLMLIGCSAPKSLYYWGRTDMSGLSAYDKNLYESYKRETPKALCELICTLDDIVCHPNGTRQVPPPGVCAEYGYLLWQDEAMTTFDQNATNAQKKQMTQSPYGSDYKQGAVKLFQMEMANYPVSVKFLKDFVERLTGQTIDVPNLNSVEQKGGQL
ncbi:MAG: hypothetical protein MJZ84_00340 [Paludibacteraceae bacterium]|nr:hypothetical protein [Paludibacteraceae bacterium]